VPIVIIVVGVALGVAVAGFPSRSHDAPLTVQAAASTSTTTLGAFPTTTTTTSTTTTTPTRPPGSVRVTVFNASSVAGSANRVGTSVKSRGFDLKAPGPDRKVQDTTVIMYRPGYDSEARALATVLGLDPGVAAPLDVALVSPDETDLAVVVGTELAKRIN